MSSVPENQPLTKYVTFFLVQLFTYVPTSSTACTIGGSAEPPLLAPNDTSLNQPKTHPYDRIV